MIVRYLLEDDYETWNHFVEQSPQGFIWDYSWWLEIVTDGDYKICALFDDDNLIVAGISLPFFSTGTIRQPLLTQSFISRKTKCSTFAKHFVPKSHLLTQFKM